ncbi:hypothetical protein O6R08_02425 [Cutibacterium equinum]|uniref:DUF2092 domain-containing protein n=1 Tax=Cutibacterium equinum TaxID=3016342 RepID=A0ABY7R2P0_9ACTN|nr:hypothetical protein [Cutibacterium equinum]WCC81003.1 hypothetical protein O6R08_02425 [Cutibacterium equinum]
MVPSSKVTASISPLDGIHTRAIIDELVAASGNGPITKVDITKKALSITVQTGSTPTVWTWQNGTIESSATQSTQTASRPFNPDDFAVEKMPSILREAAKVSGSHMNQNLQIVEYNEGTVLMTVSTKPESRTVFFRRDGSVISHLDFATAPDMTEALADAVAGAKEVGQISYQPGKGVMVDTPTATSGIVMRRTRSADMPAWAVQRKGDATETFSPTLLKPRVIVDIMEQAAFGTSEEPSDMAWTIAVDKKLDAPIMRITVDGVSTAFDTHGVDVTDQIK